MNNDNPVQKENNATSPSCTPATYCRPCMQPVSQVQISFHNFHLEKLKSWRFQQAGFKAKVEWGVTAYQTLSCPSPTLPPPTSSISSSSSAWLWFPLGHRHWECHCWELGVCNAHCAFCIYALCIAHHLLIILTPILSLINPVQMLRFKIICLCSKTCNFIFLAVINHLTWEMLWLQYHEVMINPLGQPDCKLGVFDFDSFPYACGPLDSTVM